MKYEIQTPEDEFITFNNLHDAKEFYNSSLVGNYFVRVIKGLTVVGSFTWMKFDEI